MARPVEEDANRSHNVNVEAASGITRVPYRGVVASQTLSCGDDLSDGKALPETWELYQRRPEVEIVIIQFNLGRTMTWR